MACDHCTTRLNPLYVLYHEKTKRQLPTYSQLSEGCIYRESIALVAYQAILEPGIGQFREFKSPRVHTRMSFDKIFDLTAGVYFNFYNINSYGLFSCAQIDLRKARECEFATFDEKSTSSGIAQPYARYKLKARTGGREGTTSVTTACPEAGK